MARDYKNSGRSAQSKQKAKPKKSGSGGGALWLVVGLAVGLGVAFGVHQYHLSETDSLRRALAEAIRPAAPAAKSTARPAGKPTAEKAPAKPAEDDRPRFEFYKLLPEMEVVVPEVDEPEVTAPSRPATAATPPPPKPAGNERYLLQAGSFKKPEDADRLKAQLTLLGLDTNVQSVKLSGGETWYRVRVGPFNDRERLDEARRRLQSANIDPVLLKVGT